MPGILLSMPGSESCFKRSELGALKFCSGRTIASRVTALQGYNKLVVIKFAFFDETGSLVLFAKSSVATKDAERL